MQNDSIFCSTFNFTLTACLVTPHRDERERVVCKKRAAILFSDGRSRKTNRDIYRARNKMRLWLWCSFLYLFPFPQCHFFTAVTVISRVPRDNVFLFFCTYIVFLSINTIFVKYIFGSFCNILITFDFIISYFYRLLLSNI